MVILLLFFRVPWAGTTRLGYRSTSPRPTLLKALEGVMACRLTGRMRYVHTCTLYMVQNVLQYRLNGEAA